MTVTLSDFFAGARARGLAVLSAWAEVGLAEDGRFGGLTCGVRADWWLR